MRRIAPPLKNNFQGSDEMIFNQSEDIGQLNVSFVDYQTFVTAFNSLSAEEYKVGQSIFIGTNNVPDLWISNIESTSIQYTYTSDSDFITSLKTNGYIQAGYYKLSAIEGEKADLSNYVTLDTNQTITGIKNFVGQACQFISYNGYQTGIIYLTGDGYGFTIWAQNRLVSIRAESLCPFGYSGTHTIDLGDMVHAWRNLYIWNEIRTHKNGNYGLKPPDTTSWTASKTIATEAISGSGAPTTSTVADYRGQEYVDENTAKWYKCTAITPQGTDPETYSYTWKEILLS